MKSVLGIDIGTSGCRACVLDTRGRVLARAAARLPAPLRNGPQVEQDSRHWWKAVENVLAQLRERVTLREVMSIAVDATSSTLLLCTAKGSPLGPALMYNDTRAVNEARRIAAVAPAESGAHGPSSSLAKLMVLLKGRNAKRACHALHQADWVLGTLTGRYGLSDENNALKLGFDPVGRCWPDWLQSLGIESALLPTVLPPGTDAGTIEPSLAEKWQFSTGTRIIAGTTDSTAAIIATDAHPGEAVTSLGSTMVLKVLSTRPVFAPQYGIYSHRLGDHWLTGGASNTGGAVLLQYFSTGELDELTQQLDPRCATGLDYYPLPARGERFPVNDPELEPRLHPRPAERSVFLQAILEGMAGIELRGYRLLESLGAPYPEAVYTMGGGAANPAWSEIRKQRLGIPLLRPAYPDAACGSARLALKGIREDRGPKS